MMKKFICTTFAFCIALTAVNAQSFSVVTDANSKTAFVSGELCNMSSKAFLTVVKPGADIDNLNDYNAQIAYVSDAKASLTGQLGVLLPLSANAEYGTYTLNLNDGCDLSGHRITFDFSDDGALLRDFNNLLSNSEKSISDYEAFMRTNGSAFGIDADNADYAANKAAVWAAVEKDAPYETKIEAFKAFELALSLAELNAADNVSDKQKAFEKSLIYIDNDEVLQRYGQLDDEFMPRFYANILKNKYEYNTAAERFKADLLVEIVNQAGRDTIKSVIDDNAAEIGIDISPQSKFAHLTNSQYVYIALANKSDFASLTEIKNYFDALVAESGSQTSGGNSGGSSGGGSKMSSVRVQPSTDNNTDFSQPFIDLGSVEWAAESINRLYEKNIVSGSGDKRFEPDNYVTREEFLKMAVNAFAVQNGGKGGIADRFEDADKDGWYFPYIEIGVGSGMVNGMSDTAFGIGEKITRQDMCVMIYRCLNEKGIKLDAAAAKDDFADFDKCSDYAKEAVSILGARNIINGVGENTFAPNEFATRAMAAVIIDRALNTVY